jgi:hypothetical protein
MRILSSRDYQRLEAVIRKVERMAAVQQARRFPSVGGGLDGGGATVLFPTATKTIAAIDGHPSTAVDYFLTREDRDTLIWWDGYAAANDHGDNQQPIFWLPPDPVIGDAFWLCLVVNEDCRLRMTALKHCMAVPVVRDAYWEQGAQQNGYPEGFYPNVKPDLLSHMFDWWNGKWGREQLVFNVIRENIIQNIVVVYTGEKVQYPTGYIDTDGDTHFNAHAGDLHPLILEDYTRWAVVDMGETTHLYAAGSPWWSGDAPYG